MSCIDCPDCYTVTPSIPECFEDQVTWGIGDPSSTYFLKFTKHNGAQVTQEVTSQLSGAVVYDPQDIESLNWWAPGVYQVEFFDENANPVALTDSYSTEAQCLIFEVSGSGPPDVAISFRYTTT